MPVTLTCRNCGHKLTRPDIIPLESPFPNLLNLHSNVVLPSLQTDVITNSISSALRDVSQLDQDILRLENTLHELLRKRDETHSFAMAHKGLISPIRRVPPEIITEVFLYSAGGDFGNPIILASICSRWRSIALSSPQLWASFTMAVNPELLESQVSLAKVWLSRAGKHPLSIYLDVLEDEFYPEAPLAHTQALVDLFVARCEQWQTIRLALPSDIITCLSGAKDRLHRLEKLTFGGYIDWDTSCQDISAVFATAPKLRFLRFDYLSSGTRLQLPWQQLHELSMDGELSAHNCLDILETTSRLQKCEFWIGFTEAENTHASSSIILPMLRCMTICFTNDPLDLPYFLSAVHLPAIQELTISNVRNHGGAIIIPLNFPSAVADAIVVAISHGSLLKLVLGLSSITQITSASIASILRAAPKLMELSLMEGAALVLSREFVDQFNNASNACLVPNLQKLELECLDGFDIPTALGMIESRCLANYRNPLEQLLLKWDMEDPIDSALKSRLLLMTQSGLDVQLFLRDATTPIELV